MEKQKSIKIYTDGACQVHGSGAGGWAFVAIFPNGMEVQHSGGEVETTANKMELTAVLKALEYFPEPQRIVIISDSKYVVNCIDGWIEGWRYRGWITSLGEPVKNTDILFPISDLVNFHDVRAFWVKGHSGDKYNEAANSLAQSEIKYFTPCYKL